MANIGVDFKNSLSSLYVNQKNAGFGVNLIKIGSDARADSGQT